MEIFAFILVWHSKNIPKHYPYFHLSIRDKASLFPLTRILYEKETNLSLRPNPDRRINRKPDGQIFVQTAESIKYQTAEFHHSAK